MAKSWKDYNYTTVNLPTNLIKIIDKIVNENDFYRTRAHFIRMAIEEKIDKFNEGVIADSRGSASQSKSDIEEMFKELKKEIKKLNKK